MEHFKIATANRHQFDYENSFALSAVNAVALARDMSWEDSFHLLLNQAHRYGILPAENRCVENMLLDAGYAPVPGLRDLLGYAHLNRVLMEKYPNVTSGLAITALGRSFQKRVCAIRRQGSEGFVAMDTRAESRSILQVYLPWDEIGVAKPAVEDPDAVKMRHCTPIPEHESYRYFQPNPRNNSVGDCVIRAYSAVFDVSWDEALEMVARSNEYATTTLNGWETDRYLTSEYGFTYHDRPIQNGRGVNGAQFCAHLTATCRQGERIFAQAGAHHVVGIVPVDTPVGQRYVIKDSWDSTVRKIGQYFVYLPEKKAEPVVPAQPEKPVIALEIAQGRRLSHPRFGIGTIAVVSDGRVTVDFVNGGQKTFSAAWVRGNCVGA